MEAEKSGCSLASASVAEFNLFETWAWPGWGRPGQRLWRSQTPAGSWHPGCPAL